MLGISPTSARLAASQVSFKGQPATREHMEKNGFSVDAIVLNGDELYYTTYQNGKKVQTKARRRGAAKADLAELKALQDPKKGNNDIVKIYSFDKSDFGKDLEIEDSIKNEFIFGTDSPQYKSSIENTAKAIEARMAQEKIAEKLEKNKIANSPTGNIEVQKKSEPTQELRVVQKEILPFDETSLLSASERFSQKMKEFNANFDELERRRLPALSEPDVKRPPARKAFDTPVVDKNAASDEQLKLANTISKVIDYNVKHNKGLSNDSLLYITVELQQAVQNGALKGIAGFEMATDKGYTLRYETGKKGQEQFSIKSPSGRMILENVPLGKKCPINVIADEDTKPPKKEGWFTTFFKSITKRTAAL